MINADNGGPIIALILSVGLHAGLFALVPETEGAKIEAGSGESGAIRLGNSFADMIAGSSGAAEAVQPDQSSVSAIPEVQPVSTASVATPVAAVPVAQTDTSSAKPVTVAAGVAAPVVDVRPAAPDQTVVATEPVPKAKPKSEKTSEKNAEPKAQAGTEENARAGTSTGMTNGKATTAASTTAAGTAGNSKASNYPGAVMKKLSRTRKDRVAGNGTALVAFTIAQNGSVASVSIIKSSGSAAIDKAALTLVKRAAPFPAPPTGAERNFSFEFSS